MLIPLYFLRPSLKTWPLWILRLFKLLKNYHLTPIITRHLKSLKSEKNDQKGDKRDISSLICVKQLEGSIQSSVHIQSYIFLLLDYFQDVINLLGFFIGEELGSSATLSEFPKEHVKTQLLSNSWPLKQQESQTCASRWIEIFILNRLLRKYFGRK